MRIVDLVKKELLVRNQNYIENVENYNFWESHIKYVVKNALELAEIYNADKEIVELGALLHDIALVSNVGTKANHHLNGATIAEEILNNFEYPKEKTKRVVNCVLRHRSSKNATNIEELCVCDADILAHFDNIAMCFECAFNLHKIETVEEATKWVRAGFEKDYNDLSEQTKSVFCERYKTIMDVLFGRLF